MHTLEVKTVSILRGERQGGLPSDVIIRNTGACFGEPGSNRARDVARAKEEGYFFVPRESPIQGHRSGDESSGKLYEASGAWRNTAHRLGKYGKGMDPCAKIGRPAHGSMSQREWIEM